MKNIFFLLISFLLLQSCDILDVDPLDSIPAEDAIKDKRSMQAALNGIYNQMQSPALAMDVIVFGDLAADNLIHVGTKKEYRQISDQRIVPENAYIQGVWDDSYDAINQVNNMIFKLPGVSGVSDEEIRHVSGQLYFLRALNYFNLVRLFGGVPLKIAPTTNISPVDLYTARATVEETYALIIRDLEKALADLDGTGRGTSAIVDEGAVHALSARVNLYLGRWQSALDEVKAVESLGYGLVAGDAYASLFDEAVTNDEIIFQIDFLKDDDINGIADWFMPEARFEVAAWANYQKTRSVNDEFATDDKRRSATVGSTGDDYYGNKYQDYSKGKDNMIILRLAEMYLIAAEALNELGYDEFGEAFYYLNLIRIRAGLPLLTPADLPDQASFRLAVEEERRLELAFEGHRYYDLVRTGRAGDVLEKRGPLTGENQFLFPIPQSEIDANESIKENNPGY